MQLLDSNCIIQQQACEASCGGSEGTAVQGTKPHRLATSALVFHAALLIKAGAEVGVSESQVRGEESTSYPN